MKLLGLPLPEPDIKLPYRHNKFVQPFLKWAGGKRQLLPQIEQLLPKKFGRYFEPFVGAGAVFFHLQRSRVVINDFNAELMNCYKAIQFDPEQLISLVNSYPVNKEEFFYKLRALDRTPDFKDVPNLERAARIIYLNKTCFNGLFRVNSQGQFNVPFGDYRNPRIVEPNVIRAISQYLNRCSVEFRSGDFELAIRDAKKGDFIYFDPPYHPTTDTASFTGYSLNGFGEAEQRRLKDVCDHLTETGCFVLISNSATELIEDLYRGRKYCVVPVEANRNINSVGSGRGKVTELLIHNKYDLKSQ